MGLRKAATGSATRKKKATKGRPKSKPAIGKGVLLGYARVSREEGQSGQAQVRALKAAGVQ